MFLRSVGARDMSKLYLLRFIAIAAVAAVAAAGMGSAAFAQKTRLTVYTALENDQIEPFRKSFEADNPTIEIAWVRDSTGAVAAKLMAERDNPSADVIWGLAASNVDLMASMDMLEPYTPAGAAALKPIFRSGRSPDTWIGMDAYLAVVCFNVAVAEKSKKAAPMNWVDLIKPEYKALLLCRTRLRQARVTSLSPLGCKSWVRRRAGNTWTHFTKISPNTSIPDRHLACRRQMAFGLLASAWTRAARRRRPRARRSS